MNFLLIFMIFAGLVALWSAARLVQRREIRRAGFAWLYLSVGDFLPGFLRQFYFPVPEAPSPIL